MLNLDDLRARVALKHNILLAENDPVLVTLTLNELVIARYAEILAEQNALHQRAVTDAIQGQVEQSKATAGRLITDASNHVCDQVRQAATTALDETNARLRQYLGEANAARQEAATARTTAIMAAVAAAVFAVLAFVFLAAFLLK